MSAVSRKEFVISMLAVLVLTGVTMLLVFAAVGQMLWLRMRGPVCWPPQWPGTALLLAVVTSTAGTVVAAVS